MIVHAALLALLAQQPSPAPGVGIGGCTEGARSRVFVDLGRGFRPFQEFNGGGRVATDERGWPLGDGFTVIFDIRPTFAWAPPIDDPDRFQPDWSGSYALSFRGQAEVRATGSDGLSIEDLSYDPDTDITRGRVVVPQGAGLLLLEFRNTSGGVRDLHVIRPGYDPDTTQLFTNEFLSALEPFSTLRFMGFTATNNNGPLFTDDDNLLHWSDRHTPDDATQQNLDATRKFGCAWEYAIALANAAHKDIWINVPVAADDGYVRELAKLLNETLDPTLNIYVEHSNEVWNPGFRQYAYNLAAADAEVNANRDTSNLNKPATADRIEWARRRHARRLIEIGEIFIESFGSDAINQRVRLVHSWWTIRSAEYARVLSWIETHYGPPASRLYAIAKTQYFDTGAARADATVDDVIDVLRRSSDGQRGNTQAIAAVAQQYGVKLIAYEGGPGDNVGSTTGLANRIRAHRDPRLRELVRRDLLENWYPLGGDLHMYLELSSAYSRFGCWGLNEDVIDRNTPKYLGFLDTLAQGQPQQQ